MKDKVTFRTHLKFKTGIKSLKVNFLSGKQPRRTQVASKIVEI